MDKRSLFRRLAIIVIGAACVAAAPQQRSSEDIVTHLTLDELPHLREEITLGSWKSLHSTDTLELYSPKLAMASYPNGEWCARMMSETPLDSNRRVRRTVYFYLPAEPNPPVLPSNLRQEELVLRCWLGFVWSEVEDADSVRAQAFGEAVRESVKKDLGRGEMDLQLDWLGSASWSKTGYWENGRLAVASAVTRPDRRPAIIVGAAGGISGMRFRQVDSATNVVERKAHVALHQVVWSRIEEALSIARLGGPAEASFRASLRMITEADGWWSRFPTPSEESTIFEAIDRWLTTSSSLIPARRSAALFAADQLFQESGGPRWGQEENPPIRQRLEARGAKFEWLELAGSYTYTHTWLKDAVRLDPNGRAGELAFLTLMEMGFETSGACADQNGEGFRAVIAQGQEYLRRNPNSLIAPDIHFMMGQAYGDIVNLGAGGGYDGTDNEKYKSEAASTRPIAIEQFRAGFNSANNTPRAREAWPDAWRLIAGLPPSRTYFYCVYD